MEKNLRPYLVELIGTLAFVFLSAGAICANQLAAISFVQQPGLVVQIADTEDAAKAQQSVYPVILPPPKLELTGIALTTGLIFAAALAITLPLTGGYLNPAVTLTLWVFKKLDGERVIWLISMQLLGAAIAGLLLRFLFGFREDVLVAAHLGTPHLSPEMTGVGPSIAAGAMWRGLAAEIVLTFFLVFAIFGTVIDPRAPKWASGWVGRLAALWIGLVVIADTFVGYGLTGAALNPARWFGTAIWEMTVIPLRTQGPFRDHAVYWIGPTVGALIAGALYTMLVLPAEEEPHHGAHHEGAHHGGTKPAGVTSTLFRARK